LGFVAWNRKVWSLHEKKFEQQYGYWNWKEFHRLNGLKLLGLLFVWIVVIVLLYQIFPDFALWHREG
jgi:hypothetical protein